MQTRNAVAPQISEQMLQRYLAQQRHAGHPPPPLNSYETPLPPAAAIASAIPQLAESTSIVEVPNNEELNDFKNQVRLWLELDNMLKKLKAAVKERQVAKKELTERILEFMGKYNIEDLNTRDGKLRYKVVNVKEPLTQNVIKTRIKEKIESGDAAAADPDEVVDQVFQREQVSQKIVLKRLGRRSMQVS